MYHTLSVWGGGLAVFIIALLVDAIGLGDTGTQILVILYLPIALMILASGFASLFGYHSDAKYLKETESSFTPIWPLWVLGHLIIGAPFVAPLYLIRRSLAVGGNDYSGTNLERVFS